MGDSELVPAPKPEHPARATYDAQILARQEAFLVAFSKAGNIGQAARAVGISYQAVRDWRKDDDLGFRSRYEVAHEEFADHLEQLACEKIETLSPRHDVLHIAMLNAHRPELYRPTQPLVDLGQKEALDAMTQAVVQFNNAQIQVNINVESGPEDKPGADIIDMISNPEDQPAAGKRGLVQENGPVGPDGI